MKIGKATKIVDLVINEGSAVDRPANKQAKIVLFKRAAGAERKPESNGGSLDDTANKQEREMNVKKARSVEEIMSSLPPEDQQVMAAYVEQQMSAAKDAAPPPPAPEAKAEEMAKVEADVRKAYDAKIAKMQAEIDGMNTERKRERALAKAASYNVPGAKVEEIADVLMKFADDEKAAAVIDGIMGAARAAVEKSGILNPVGGQSASCDSVSPEAKLGALAEEIQKSDTKLTWHQAYVRAAERNPKLASQCK